VGLDFGPDRRDVGKCHAVSVVWPPVLYASSNRPLEFSCRMYLNVGLSLTSLSLIHQVYLPPLELDLGSTDMLRRFQRTL
jgi:hypothetical protein